jgi:hypothetical protein
VRTEVLREAVQSGCYRRVAAGDRRAATVCLVPWEQLERLPEAQVVWVGEEGERKIRKRR